jgi:chemotaxis signal transduction protein
LCISLHGLLAIAGGEEAAAATVRVLVITVAGQRWVFLVDAVKGVHRFHQSSVIDVPATSRGQRPYVSGLVVSDGMHYGLLDLPRICAGLQESIG